MSEAIDDLEVAGPNEVEILKAASRQLRGSLAEEFASPSIFISDAGYQLLKFHGSYQQDDRDLRNERRKAGQEYAFSFMIRLRLPGGDVHPELYLALDRLADELGNGTLRFTTRQSIQLHGILKHDLRTVIRTINDRLADTLGACGDVNRNVMAAPAPLRAPRLPARARGRARQISEHLLPKTRAYAELWLDGDEMGKDELGRVGPKAGAAGRRADLRQDLPAAQVQDRGRRGRRQQRGPLHPRPRRRARVRRLRACRLERVRGRRPRPHAQEAGDVPAARRRARVRGRRTSCCAWPRAWSWSSATTATAPTGATRA